MTKLAQELMKPEVFEATMAYFPVRGGNSRNIAYSFWVLGMPASGITSTYGCTKQNVVKVLDRFAQAYERYVAAVQNSQAAPISDLPPVLLDEKPKAPAKKAAVKKAAAKKSAGPAVAPAKKVAAKKAAVPKKTAK